MHRRASTRIDRVDVEHTMAAAMQFSQMIVAKTSHHANFLSVQARSHLAMPNGVSLKPARALEILLYSYICDRRTLRKWKTPSSKVDRSIEIALAHTRPAGV